MWIVFLLVIMETADLEELRKIIDTKIIYLVSGDFGCTDCDYTSKFRHNLPKHIESRNITNFSLNCPTCFKICFTWESLRRHLSRVHK